MVDPEVLLRIFAEYADTLAEPYDVTDVLYRLTDQVAELLGIDGAGVSLADDDGELHLAAATDERIATVEEHQVQVGEGPCHEAYRAGHPITSSDLASEERWPNLRPVALDQGCRALAGIPMAVADTAIGAMLLSCEAPRGWSDDEVAVAQVLANMATGYIVNARARTEAQRLAAQLQHALSSRVPIEQAKGMLAERHGISTSAAFERLRRHARDHNERLVATALAVVEGTLEL
jgi:GAF domain-containing protein